MVLELRDMRREARPNHPARVRIVLTVKHQNGPDDVVEGGRVHTIRLQT
jgi:hypothetical protein